MSLASTPSDLLVALADAAVKGTLVLALAAGVTTLLRRAAAATRHLVWSTAVAGVLALPLVARVAPQWTLAVLPARAVATTPAPFARDADAASATAPMWPSSSMAPSALPQQHAATPPAIEHASEHPSTPQPIAAPATSRTTSGLRVPAVHLSLAGWALVVWAVGALAVLARLAFGALTVRRLTRRAELPSDPAWIALVQQLTRDLGIERPVVLRIGGAGTMPITWGVVYPAVLLPADAATWTEERRRAVLLHELAHVERFDALTHVVTQLALAVFWFHPLVGLAARRLRTERERACDDLVLAVGTRASNYASDLLELVQTLGATPASAAALAMARRSEFEGRLLAILDPAVPRARTSRRAAALACTVAAIAVVPLAAARPTVRPTARPATHPIARATARVVTPPVARATTPTPAAQRPVAADPTPATPMARRASLATQVATLGTSTLGAAATALAERTRALAAALQGCRPRTGTHVTVHDDGVLTRTTIADDQHCVEVVIVGRVTFTSDEDDVASLAPGGAFDLSETRGGVTRYLRIRERGGVLERSYFVDGDARPLVESASWLNAIVPTLARESRVGVEDRVARVRRARGLTGVLATVSTITSDEVKRLWLQSLLDGSSLAGDDLVQIARTATGIASDGEKARVLLDVLARGRGDAPVALAVVEVARTIASDGDKRRVLVAVAEDRGLPSTVLTRVADVARELASDGEHAKVLLTILPSAREETVRVAVLRSATTIASDGERANVLMAAVTPSLFATDAGRTAYFSTVDGIASDGERRRVLVAVVRMGDPSPATLAAVARSASHIASDSEKSETLLAIVNRPQAMQQPVVREAVLSALRTVSSGSDYRRVMEVVTR